MLINGDDILMTLNPKDYSDWWAMVRSCGLEPSLGKNYISDEFAMINSELWIENKDLFGEHAYWEFAPFVSLGLLKMQKKVLGDTRKDTNKKNILASDLVSTSLKLLRGFSGERRENLYSIWITENLQSIKDVTLPGQNWFIPSQLGGLGLPLPGEVIRITRGQGKMASFLAAMTENKLKFPRFSVFRPTYLHMEDFFLQKIRRAVNYEWTEEKREDPFPSTAQYFESQYGRDEKSMPEEVAHENARVQREWDSFWTTTTNSRLEAMTDARVRTFAAKKFLPEARYIIRGSYLSSSVFSD
jgi:hypothetical protein